MSLRPCYPLLQNSLGEENILALDGDIYFGADDLGTTVAKRPKYHSSGTLLQCLSEAHRQAVAVKGSVARESILGPADPALRRLQPYHPAQGPNTFGPSRL